MDEKVFWRSDVWRKWLNERNAYVERMKKNEIQKRWEA